MPVPHNFSFTGDAPPPVQRKTSVPSQGFLGPLNIGENIWIVRSLFSLGADQSEGLTYAGLKARVLESLGEKPICHPALQVNNNESTKEELMEEINHVQDLVAGRHVAFPLDSTMTIIRGRGGTLTLHSVVPLTTDLQAAVASLGQVSTILAPNLQHWLYLPDWLEQYPEASVGLAPSAYDECLHRKLSCLADHQGRVFTLGESQAMAALAKEAGLVGSLLEGAPLSLNEFLFYHRDSGTLVASDTFYGGYVREERPTWFARLWFKLTRDGSFRDARLPIYRSEELNLEVFRLILRTSRVLSHGDREMVLESASRVLHKFGHVTR